MAIGADTQQVLQNSRAKIFALLHKLEFEAAPSMLSTHEQIDLLTIKHYLNFKRAEVWLELQTELEREGVEPTEARGLHCAPGTHAHRSTRRSWCVRRRWRGPACGRCGRRRLTLCLARRTPICWPSAASMPRSASSTHARQHRCRVARVKVCDMHAAHAAAR